MIEFAHKLRKAYIDRLATVKLNGVSIPVADELFLGTPVQIGQAKCYIITTNQTSNDNKTTFTTDTYTATIQIDIVTQFAVNSGTKLLSEQIAEQVINALKTPPITVPGMHISRYWIETNRGLREDSETSRIYRKILIFNHNINE